MGIKVLPLVGMVLRQCLPRQKGMLVFRVINIKATTSILGVKVGVWGIIVAEDNILTR